MIKYATMKKSAYYLTFLFFIFLLFSCTETIQEEFVAPSITIISIEVIDGNTCVVTFEIKKGLGATIQNANFIFTDITEVSQIFEFEINLRAENEYIDSLFIELPVSFHDFRVTGQLESKRNTFFSNSKLVHFSQDFYFTNPGITSVDLRVSPRMRHYIDIFNGIGDVARKGERATVILSHRETPPQNTVVTAKLNGVIPVETDFYFTRLTGSSQTWGGIYIPEDIEEGIYSVHLYINNQEFIASSLLRVIPVNSEIIFLENHPDYLSVNSMFLSTSFVSGNTAFYLFRIPNGRLVAHNIETNTWTEKNNVPFFHNSHVVTNHRITYNGNNFILINNQNFPNIANWRVELWKYFEKEDRWEHITNHPKNIVSYHTMVIGENLYVFGGRTRSTLHNQDNSVPVNEVWAFNFETKQWTQKNDMPELLNQQAIATASDGEKGYILTMHRRLYKYNPLLDEWKQISELRGGAVIRSHSTLLYNNNKLYIVGGFTWHNPQFIQGDVLTDTWEYCIASNEWRLIDVFNANSEARFSAFFYNNQIFTYFMREWHPGSRGRFFYVKITP